jgi:phage portal protein BeeE
MNWLQRVWNAARTSREKPDTSGSLCVNSTQAGIPIDDARALAYSSVWACVRVISETIAQLPWKTYQKAPRGKKDIAPEKNTVAWLLQMQPNPETTAFRWKRLMAAHVLTRGNAYSEIERDTQGRPLWLWPIDPDRVKPMRDDTGALAYEVRNANRESVIVPASDMLHFRGLGDNDTVGVSVIAKAKESIALGLAMERFGASFFGNGANLSGVVTHPGKLSPDAKTNIEESLKKRASGRNTLSTLVFEEGMKYEKNRHPARRRAVLRVASVPGDRDLPMVPRPASQGAGTLPRDVEQHRAPVDRVRHGHDRSLDVQFRRGSEPQALRPPEPRRVLHEVSPRRAAAR